jgi:hypothetical protein
MKPPPALLGSIAPSALSLALALAACGSASDAPPPPDPTAPGASSPAPSPPAATGDRPPDPTPAPAPAPAPAPKGPLKLTAVTFNTGISPGAHHDAPPDDGFDSSAAKKNADYYGNGLAWNAAIQDTAAFFAQLAPDVVVFQEIFHPGECPSVPQGARAGFVCDGWQPGDPTVAQRVLGAGYQIACNLGKPDKCAAVKTSFGKLRGCSSALCLDGLAGAQVNGCGKGSRVGRGVIDLAAGGSLTLVNVHGSSGFSQSEHECRKKQFEQVFVDLDGAPAASGARNLVLGDFNTDPGRLAALDVSAQTLVDHVGSNKKFHFVTDVGPTVTPTYRLSIVPFLPAGFNIDHVISDALKGSCYVPGITQGKPPVTSMVYFDHHPAVCTLSE